MAIAIYGAFAAAAIPSIAFVSQNVVRDLNLAMTELALDKWFWKTTVC